MEVLKNSSFPTQYLYLSLPIRGEGQAKEGGDQVRPPKKGRGGWGWPGGVSGSDNPPLLRTNPTSIRSPTAAVWKQPTRITLLN